MKSFKMPNVPSFESFQSQVPSLESFMGKVPTLESFQNGMPSMEDFQKEFESKANVDITGLEGLANLPTTGSIAQTIGEKFGINIDGSKIDEIQKKIDDFKSAAKDKTLEAAKNVANIMGINLPEVPSKEEVISFVTEKAKEIPQVQDGVDKTKLAIDGLSSKFIPDVESIKMPEIDYEAVSRGEIPEIPNITPEFKVPDISIENVSNILKMPETKDTLETMKSSIQSFIDSKLGK